jgi:L-ascorbate 6-phosphate lactonase
MERHGVSGERMHVLEVNKTKHFEGFDLHGVYADHGEAEPNALGVVIEIDGIRIYHTGDTGYRPDRMGQVIEMHPDIVIPCTNGTYGNMNAIEAARLAADVAAKVAIPCHFWLFIGQNFLGGMPALCSVSEPRFRKCGESVLYTSENAVSYMP